MNKEHISHLDSISRELEHIKCQNMQIIKKLSELDIKRIDHREIINIKEASEILNLTEKTIRTYVSKGKLKAHKRGKPLLFKKSELEVRK